MSRRRMGRRGGGGGVPPASQMKQGVVFTKIRNLPKSTRRKREIRTRVDHHLRHFPSIQCEERRGGARDSESDDKGGVGGGQKGVQSDDQATYKRN